MQPFKIYLILKSQNSTSFSSFSKHPHYFSSHPEAQHSARHFKELRGPLSYQGATWQVPSQGQGVWN